MDELAELRAMRADLPGPLSGSKEQLWSQLEREMDRPRHVSWRNRLTRTYRKGLIGLFLIGIVAISPLGSAIADRIDDVLSLTEKRRILYQQDQKIQDYFSHRPPVLEGTPQQRMALSAAEINAITKEGSEKLGGGPRGVILRVPLDSSVAARIGTEKSDCALVIERFPDDHICELSELIQAGKLPPGYYSQAKIDAIFSSGR
ncbi:MAG: hypothetical protein J0H66_06190 [Solirubrobacterales bacterium]|nr:hypothetical protein [Solirubrobacterales bacterium]